MDPVTPVPVVTPPVVEPLAPVVTPVVTPPAEDVASLPAWAQKMLSDTRQEAAKDRTEAKKTAADEARKLLAQEVGKALGLIETPDPAAAAKQAADERDSARQEARSVKIENAVLKAARRHDADPEALTDSRSFMAKLASIDPAADDFGVQVDTAIAAAVTANPLLKIGPAVPTPPPRSGAPVNGGVPIPGQLTREQLKGMKPEDILKAKDAGQLNNILGIT